MPSDDRVWLLRSVLALFIISSVFGAYMQYQLNSIVHGALYDYGLQFSDAWAVPYWSMERMVYVYLYVPFFCGVGVLVYDLWKSRSEKVPAVKSIDLKDVNLPTGKRGSGVQTAANNAMLINCPKCDRVFGRPMNMLDFSSGRAKLVNVCPYCNQVLGDAEPDNVKFRVGLREEEEVLKRK